MSDSQNAFEGKTGEISCARAREFLDGAPPYERLIVRITDTCPEYLHRTWGGGYFYFCADAIPPTHHYKEFPWTFDNSLRPFMFMASLTDGPPPSCSTCVWWESDDQHEYGRCDCHLKGHMKTVCCPIITPPGFSCSNWETKE